jgi:hypothetical protein
VGYVVKCCVCGEQCATASGTGSVRGCQQHMLHQALVASRASLEVDSPYGVSVPSFRPNG